MGHGSACDGLSRQLLGRQVGRRRGDVDHDGGGQTETVAEGLLEIDQARIGVDDLDTHDALAQRSIQQAADLEATQPEPLTDLLLAELHPVVQLRDEDHLAHIAAVAAPRGQRLLR